MIEQIGNLYDLIQWPGVVVLMALETVIFFIPSEAVMTMAGWLLIKDKGYGPEWILLAAALGGLGSTLGSIFAYYVGAWGRPLIARYGRYVLVTEQDLESSERFFERWGTWAVFFGRMVPLVRTFVSIPAGTARMDLKIFTIYTFLGSTIWAGFLATLGYIMGENWERVQDWVGPADIIIVALFAVGLAFYIFLHIKKFREVRQPSRPEA